MTLTLASLARGCHDALAAGDTPAAREQAAQLLAQALRDPAFLQEQFAQPVPERKIAYEDPELGFCILVHEYHDAREGGPHDHGPSWAIYGQAEGETIMTDWAKVAPASETEPGKVRHVRDYKLTPGAAHVYNEGDLHSPRRDASTKLIRIEGRNVEKIRRFPYEAVA